MIGLIVCDDNSLCCILPSLDGAFNEKKRFTQSNWLIPSGWSIAKSDIGLASPQDGFYRHKSRKNTFIGYRAFNNYQFILDWLNGDSDAEKTVFNFFKNKKNIDNMGGGVEFSDIGLRREFTLSDLRKYISSYENLYKNFISETEFRNFMHLINEAPNQNESEICDLATKLIIKYGYDKDHILNEFGHHLEVVIENYNMPNYFDSE